MSSSLTAELAGVIVSHNSSEAALQLSRQLIGQGAREVILLDTGSTAEQRKMLSGSALPAGIRLKIIVENIGFGLAANRAVSLLRESSYILICNADVELGVGSVRRITESAGRNPDAVITPLILTGDRRTPVYWFRGASFTPSRGYVRHLAKGKPAGEREKGLLSVSFAPATALLVPTGLFSRLGGFREDLFMYWEDADFSLKAIDFGVGIFCDLEARVWHEVGGSEMKTTPQSRSASYYYYLQRNRFLVCGSRYGALPMFLGRGWLQMLWPFANILLRDRTNLLLKLRASLRGVKDGVRGISGRTWHEDDGKSE